MSDFLWALFELKLRIKKRILIVSLVCILAIGLGVGYFLDITEEASVDTPSLTAQRVVSTVQVYGAPYLDYFLNIYAVGGTRGSSYAVGYWAAIYEGYGYWKIQGDVVAIYKGITTPYRTVWQYNEISYTLELTSVSRCGAEEARVEEEEYWRHWEERMAPRAPGAKPWEPGEPLPK